MTCLERTVAVARRRPDRWCTALAQRDDGSLRVAVTHLSPGGQWVAESRDWQAARRTARGECSRILAQIRGLGCCRDQHWTAGEWRALAAGAGNQLDVLYDWLARAVAAHANGVGLPQTWPLEVIARPTGDDDWAHRLLEQRTDWRIRFRRPLLREEEAGVELSGFVAYALE